MWLGCDDDQPTWFSTPSTRVPAFSHFFLFNPSHKKNPQVRPCRCVVASRTSLFGVITQTWYTALHWYRPGTLMSRHIIQVARAVELVSTNALSISGFVHKRSKVHLAAWLHNKPLKVRRGQMQCVVAAMFSVPN